MMQDEVFSTDLQRLTEILAINLYDDPFVPIREVLQNANDACLIRQGFSAHDAARITVSLDRDKRVIDILDSGCGMTETELQTVLSRIASSNKVEKRNKLLKLDYEPARAIAGKFGLGMLSCFIIAREVEIFTSSMERGCKPLYWHSRGDGKYRWQEHAEPLEVGTRVRLHLKNEQYLNPLLERSRVQAVIDKYCRYLRVPIYLGDSPVPMNSSVAPWHQGCPDDEIELYTRTHFNAAPLYHFQLEHDGDVKLESGLFEAETAKSVSLQALAFIPDSCYWRGAGEAQVYVAGIHVGRLKEVLPPWFTFGSLVLESPSLDLTLGRDNVVQDKWRDAVRQVVAQQIQDHIFAELKDRSSLLRSRFDAVFQVHEGKIKEEARTDRVRGDGRFFEAVKDMIPFHYRGNSVSIPEFARITPPQGEVEGKRVIYYFSRGQGERGNGLQERLVFDSADIPYFDAENYYDRDFLETYSQTSEEYKLIGIQKGLEYVLQFDVPSATQELVTQVFEQLGLRARACTFRPHDVPAVITAVSRKRRDRDFDISTREGREQMLEAFVKKEVAMRSETGYTICVNLDNPLIAELVERIREVGPQPAYRMALRLVYNNAVIMFGEHSNKEMANVVSTSNSLMRSYLSGIAETDAVRNRLGTLIGEKERELSDLEAAHRTLVGRLAAEAADAEEERRKQLQRIFVAHSFHSGDQELFDTLALALHGQHGFEVVTGCADTLGRVGEEVMRKILTCGYFIGLMTRRRVIGEDSYSTSSWLLEEKGVALGAGKKVLLLVENGVGDEFFGTMQGDSQRYHFDRSSGFAKSCAEIGGLLDSDREEQLKVQQSGFHHGSGQVGGSGSL